MKAVKQLADVFASLRLRDRVVSVASVGAVLVLAGNLVLLKPQQIEIRELRAKDEGRLAELAQMRKVLAEIKQESDKGVDPLAAERAKVKGLVERIGAVERFIEQMDGGGHQLSALLRSMIKANPQLVLDSLKTRQGEVFYTPPAPPAAAKESVVRTEIDRVLASVKKEEPKKKEMPVLVKAPVYKHGVEVTVRGTYPALMAYIGEVQAIPQRVFWSGVELDASNHREAKLKFLVYTLSKSQVSSFN